MKSLKKRIEAFPNASLEDLCASTSPKVRFEFYEKVDGVKHAFYSVEGYRIGTMIAIKRGVHNREDMAQKILDETINELNQQVNNVGFSTSIDVIEGGRYREHRF